MSTIEKWLHKVMLGEVTVVIDDSDAHPPTFHGHIQHFEWDFRFLIVNVTKCLLCKEDLEMAMENAYV